MKNSIRCCIVLAAMVCFTGAAGFAQTSGEAIYKGKCLNCHGPAGLANSGVGKLMKVKPVTDPDVRKMTEIEMVQLTRDGQGKMHAYKGELTDAQTKATVDYFRTFLK